MAILVGTVGCATQLTESGQSVRLVTNKADYGCEHVGTVAGSNASGTSTAHDADGAMNDIRNRAAALGANGIYVMNIDTNEYATTIFGEAVTCKFN